MKKLSIITLTLLGLLLLFAFPSFADQPPDPGGGPGTGDDPVGGGSPVGGGLLLLIFSALVYGYNKFRNIRK